MTLQHHVDHLGFALANLLLLCTQYCLYQLAAHSSVSPLFINQLIVKGHPWVSPRSPVGPCNLRISSQASLGSADPSAGDGGSFRCSGVPVKQTEDVIRPTAHISHTSTDRMQNQGQQGQPIMHEKLLGFPNSARFGELSIRDWDSMILAMSSDLMSDLKTDSLDQRIAP